MRRRPMAAAKWTPRCFRVRYAVWRRRPPIGHTPAPDHCTDPGPKLMGQMAPVDYHARSTLSQPRGVESVLSLGLAVRSPSERPAPQTVALTTRGGLRPVLDRTTELPEEH